MSIVTISPVVQIDVVVKPKKWKLVNLTVGTLAGGAALGFPLINSFGKDIYINTIRVTTEGGLATVNLTDESGTIETRIINATTPNVEFDFKEGIILKSGKALTLDFYNKDTSSQDIVISYIYTEVT